MTTPSASTQQDYGVLASSASPTATAAPVAASLSIYRQPTQPFSSFEEMKKALLWTMEAFVELIRKMVEMIINLLRRIFGRAPVELSPEVYERL
ncbi:MAG: hypothetical protein P3W87_003865 [Gammaproteobacteria bacterium]|nr:hypothetical protein [Gammaproteobacteria bacterium]